MSLPPEGVRVVAVEQYGIVPLAQVYDVAHALGEHTESLLAGRGYERAR